MRTNRGGLLLNKFLLPLRFWGERVVEHPLTLLTLTATPLFLAVRLFERLLVHLGLTLHLEVALPDIMPLAEEARVCPLRIPLQFA